jgi:hypothetical protein
VRFTPAVARFLVEAAFIVAVAAATAVARLDKLWIALAVAGAWVLVTLVERAAKQDQPALIVSLIGAVSGRRGPRRASHPEPEPPAPLPDPPAPEPAPPAPEPDPPGPEPEQPTPQLRSVPSPPEPDPVEAAEPEQDGAPMPPEAPVLPFRPRSDGAPREWNVWELERIAQERLGQDAARDEELAFLLLELRQFANADGQLPVDFDPIVRDAFGDSLYATA